MKTFSSNEVVQLTGLSEREIRSLVMQGQFPKPLPLGPWTSGWDRDEIQTWLQQKNEARL